MGTAWVADRLWERLGVGAQIVEVAGRRRGPGQRVDPAVVERVIFAMVANRLSPTPLSKLASTEMVYANAPTPTRITLCQRGPIVLEAAALLASAWTTYNVKRAGRYRHTPHTPRSTNGSSPQRHRQPSTSDRDPHHRPCMTSPPC